MGESSCGIEVREDGVERQEAGRWPNPQCP